jgi:hypothetical protein
VRMGFVRRLKPLKILVGVAGFEPATPSSRTMCATRLRYTPRPDRGLIAATRRSCKHQRAMASAKKRIPAPAAIRFSVLSVANRVRIV